MHTSETVGTETGIYIDSGSTSSDGLLGLRYTKFLFNKSTA